MGEIITNALIRKENPLTVDVDSFGIVTIPNGKDGGKAVMLVKLGFKGINGSEKTTILGPSEFGYVGEIPVYEVHIVDSVHNRYCKSLHNEWTGFTRLESYNGKIHQIKRDEIYSVIYKKLVEVEYLGKSYFFLLPENAVIASRANGLTEIARSAYNVEDHTEIVNGL